MDGLHYMTATLAMCVRIQYHHQQELCARNSYKIQMLKLMPLHSSLELDHCLNYWLSEMITVQMEQSEMAADFVALTALK